ncbi:MAG TPA: SpoIIE family protein phosphatase, partial [Bacteroidia bacterium]|nr:SpoIIE family protein phosphatase [Bacteroidia bacterium]
NPEGHAQILASKTGKGFDHISKKEFDKAIDFFEALLEENSADAGAHFGLARVYFTKEYKAYNPDAAFEHVAAAAFRFNSIPKRETAALARHGMTGYAISSLSAKIDDALFGKASAKNSPDALRQFISRYPNSRNISKARDMLAVYSETEPAGTLDQFILNSGDADEVQRAVELRNFIDFQKAKGEGTIEALEKFIETHPDALEADDALDAMATIDFIDVKKRNTLAAYDSFLVNYPESEEFQEALSLRNKIGYIRFLENEKLRNVVDLRQRESALKLIIGGSFVLMLLAGLLYYALRQKKRANEAITQQKNIIEGKNKEIIAGILYAQRIQEAMLPLLSDIQTCLPEAFVFYKPRDIVSGDFYWFAEQGDRVYIAVADCTGHGVPGSLVSMLGFNFLNQLVNENDVAEPGEILNQLHLKMAHALNRESKFLEDVFALPPGATVEDGMDIGLICVHKAAQRVSFAGAVRPLYYFDDDGMKIIKGNLYSIGGLKQSRTKKYETHVLDMKGSAMFYLFSDGYTDQFGGPDEKKFKAKKLQELLKSIRHETIDVQGREIAFAFESWKGDYDQIDDVLFLGFRFEATRLNREQRIEQNSSLTGYASIGI